MSVPRHSEIVVPQPPPTLINPSVLLKGEKNLQRRRQPKKKGERRRKKWRCGKNSILRMYFSRENGIIIGRSSSDSPSPEPSSPNFLCHSPRRRILHLFRGTRVSTSIWITYYNEEGTEYQREAREEDQERAREDQIGGQHQIKADGQCPHLHCYSGQ